MIPAIAQTAHDRNECPMLQSGWFVWSSSSFWKCARVPGDWWLATFFAVAHCSPPTKNDRQNSVDRLVVEPSDVEISRTRRVWIVQWYCRCVATHCCLHAGLLSDKMTTSFVTMELTIVMVTMGLKDFFVMFLSINLQFSWLIHDVCWFNHSWYLEFEHSTPYSYDLVIAPHVP